MTISKATLTTKEAAIYIGVSEDFMKRSRFTGKGPAFIRIGERKVLYRLIDLNAYLESNLTRNCSLTKNYKGV